MLKNFTAALLLGAVLAAPGAAFADVSADRTEAIRLCRAEIASQAGVGEDQVRFDQVRVRGRLVRVDFDLWRSGQLQNLRCDVARGGETLAIAAITPPVHTASAAR